MMQRSRRAAIPVSVIVVTRNEASRIAGCLSALSDFSEIIVVDSGSTDDTKTIAAAHGAHVVDFKWNGRYPKKRQWCLDNLTLRHEWVFFVDADEIVTPELSAEIAALDFKVAGYFVRGCYVMGGRVLRHGLANNKLALIDRRRMEFPVVNDLDIPGMGEIEGHYQPVLKSRGGGFEFKQLRQPLLHDAYDDEAAWDARHERYARWEALMNARRAWPQEVSRMRRFLKRVFRALPFRAEAAFVHSYFLKAGFLDARSGFFLARSRWRYYRMISNASKAMAHGGAVPTQHPEKAEQANSSAG